MAEDTTPEPQHGPPAQESYGLPIEAQRRNSLVFLLNTSLNYLVGPVFYVGVLHAAILDSLEASDTIANLPEAVYLWVMPLPVLVAWCWPSPTLLRPMLTSSLIVKGIAGCLVALAFVMAPRTWIIGALVAHAGIVGITNGVRNMCVWELIGRGMSPGRRAQTLAWTFGLGPLFAVVGSCASQLILSGNFLDVVRIGPVPAPWSYVILFGTTAPVMWISAALVAWVHVPPVQVPEAEPGHRLSEVLAGLRQYFLHPLIPFVTAAFLLTYGGTMVMNNLSLFAREALGEPPENYAGLQLALRFGCKCLAGFALGWLVARVHAKSSLLVTTATCLAGVAWALAMPGKIYLLSFGLLGAGELFYVYYVNYIVGCSAPERIRENTAYTNLTTVLVGFMPLLFGAVSDQFGLRASFAAAIAIFMLALGVVGLLLPRQPAVIAKSGRDRLAATAPRDAPQ